MQSYQLFIKVNKDIDLKVGKLGRFIFPIGSYVYTGSAKTNLDKRIERHLSKKKISLAYRLFTQSWCCTNYWYKKIRNYWMYFK